MTEKEIDVLAEKLLKKIQEKQIIISHDNPFQKTILLLKNYNRTKNFIELKEREIKDLKNGVVRGKSSAITKFFPSKTICTESEYEQREQQIDLLSGVVAQRQQILNKIDLALDELKGEKYDNIVKKYYLEGSTHEEIADFYDIDVATVKRQKKNQIDKLSIILFPENT